MQLFHSTSIYKIKLNHFNFSKKLEKQYFEDSGKMITEITFTSQELIYHIITCGMPAFWANRFITNRVNEIKYKYYLLKTALEVDDDGYIIISDQIRYLDSSERHFISYYIGMFITKLISEKIFHYQYLVHLGIVSMYKKVIRTNKEPDFVGFNKRTDEYSLFEAKGRQVLRTSVSTHAKNQLASIKYISGVKPTMGIVCIAHPIIEGKRLICSIYDPIPNDNDSIEINKTELLYLYYLPIYQLIKELRTNQTSCSFTFDEMNPQKSQYKVTMSEDLFRFFDEHPHINDWNHNIHYSTLMEFKPISSDKDKDDFIEIKQL